MATEEATIITQAMPTDAKSQLPPGGSGIKFADRFKTEFAKLQPKEEAAAKEEPKKDEPKPESTEKVAAKPAKKGPLAALVKEPDKAETVETPPADTDPAAEFDEKQPNWKRAREVIQTQGKQLKELSTQIERLKTVTPAQDPKAAEEREALIKEREELRGKLESQDKDIKAIDGRYSDEYRALDKERKAAVDKAATRFESYAGRGRGDDLKEALNLPIGKYRSAQIKEVLAELDPDDKARVLTLVENAEGAEDKLRDFEADLPSKWEEIQARRTAQNEEKQAAHVKALESNYVKVVEKLPETYLTLRLVDDKDDDGSWNKDIKGAIEYGQGAIKPNGATASDVAEAFVLKQMYPRLEKRFLDLYAAHSEATARLEEFDKGGADFKGGKKQEVKKAGKPSDIFDQALAALRSDGSENI